MTAPTILPPRGAHDRELHRGSTREGQRAQLPDDASSLHPTLPKRLTLGTGRSAFPPESARFPVKIARRKHNTGTAQVFQQHSRHAISPCFYSPPQRRARVKPKQQGHTLVADISPSPVYTTDNPLRERASAGPTTTQQAKAKAKSKRHKIRESYRLMFFSAAHLHASLQVGERLRQKTHRLLTHLAYLTADVLGVHASRPGPSSASISPARRVIRRITTNPLQNCTHGHARQYA